jgi:hypothetical protein
MIGWLGKAGLRLLALVITRESGAWTYAVCAEGVDALTPLVSEWIGLPVSPDGFVRHSHWLTHRTVAARNDDRSQPKVFTRCTLACGSTDIDTHMPNVGVLVIEQATRTYKPLTSLDEVVKQSPNARRELCKACFIGGAP